MRESSYNHRMVNDAIIAAVQREGRGAQARLARAIGEKTQTVNKWCQRQTTPTTDKWAKIEQAIGLAEGDFWRMVMGEDVVKMFPELGPPARPPANSEPTTREMLVLVLNRLDSLTSVVSEIYREAEGLRAGWNAQPEEPQAMPPSPRRRRPQRPGNG